MAETTLSDVILSYIKSEAKDVYTALPATITDVSNLPQNKISVQPALNILDPDGRSYTFPILQDITIQWGGGGGAVMTYPLAVGDDVLVCFSMMSITEFRASTEGTVDPFDDRLHSLSDAFVIPRIWRDANQPSPNPDDVEIRYQDGEITIKKDSTLEFSNAVATQTLAPDGTITTTNSVATQTLSPDGTVVTKNENVTQTLSPDGEVEIVNPVATYTMLADGTIETKNENVTQTLSPDGKVEIANPIATYTMLADGTVETKNTIGTQIIKPDGEISLSNATGEWLMDSDGNTEITTTSTFSVSNSTTELISILVETLTEIKDATVLTMIGAQPLINKSTIEGLITTLQSLEA